MNILDKIGNTPLLKLRKVTEGVNAEIYVKCEFMNPGGSIKDRMALGMIEAAEKKREGKTRRNDRRSIDREHRPGAGICWRGKRI